MGDLSNALELTGVALPPTGVYEAGSQGVIDGAGVPDRGAESVEHQQGVAGLQVADTGPVGGLAELHGGRVEQATVLFDFQQLLLQDLQAKMGSGGTISGEGKLGLVHPLEEEPTLTVKLHQVPLKQERLDRKSVV